MLIANMSNIGNENYTIAMVGYVIVFVALVILVSLFIALPHLITLATRKKMRKKGHVAEEIRLQAPVTGEENAAIAMAIHLLFSEIHDEESNVITIRKISKTYSPWSSKIYGLNGIDKKPW